ncbi:adenylate/guanylate cyclase domain-containing protein [Geminicoccus roseus]|uniref:adenylate/guanylate cyclase domain-containing protein n=1 Tax=Geminicoccus roseus TaxID=404900 RepID=UPI0004072683|nr:adenylate/guanylate cyclase domain-containing protein [Geminicoccus roseus]
MRKLEDRKRPRFTLGLGGLLIGGSVGFVALVTVILVVFALLSAREAAVEPLRQGTRLVVDALAERTRDHLQAAKAQGDYISRLVARELAGRAGASEITGTLVASLAAAPQVSTVVYLRPDLTGIQVAREADRPAEVAILDLSGNEEARQAVDEALQIGAGSWGAPFAADTDPRLAYLNYRVPVRGKGDDLGLVVVMLRSDRLSRFMRDLALPPIRSAFILYDGNRVLAHPSFDGPAPVNLPRLAEMDDPALQALVAGSGLGSFAATQPGGSDGPDGSDEAPLIIREVGGRPLLYLFRDLRGFAPEPLWVGAYVNLDDVGVGPERFQTIALVGLSIVAAAAAIAALLARRLAATIRDLAGQANAVARFELEQVDTPERSRVRELDDLAQAFTAMLRVTGAFATYVPRQLVRRLLEAGHDSEPLSEQRELTVMFTDLTGFSSMAEHRPAGETARLLNEHFARLTACVVAEGGTVDKFLGDAVMAFWGAPERQADHAARALRAAAAMQEAYRDDPMRTRFGLGLRIGLHTGQVLVGDIGTPERLNYTIVGDAVNVAARLVELCREHGPAGGVVVLATGTTVHAAQAEAAMEDLGDHAVRGRFQGERVYRLCPGRLSQSARIAGTSLASS